MFFTIGDDFTWNDTTWLSHWSQPATAAAIYLLACGIHNSRLHRMKREAANAAAKNAASPSTPLLDAAAIAHNIVLVAFSALVCIIATYHFVERVAKAGLHNVLCPPPLPATSAPPPPLSGRLHYWCYVFYVSKYYEMVDTLLLILRQKPVITLHALHHAFIPLTMCLLFDGRVSFSLVALAVVNSFVHVVMYAYYLASALRMTPPVWWKKSITRLQIFQFTIGVIGGTYYWLVYVKELRVVRQSESGRSGVRSLLPLYLTYTEGCDGGEPWTVLVGYLMNAMLLFLFVRFYQSAYRRKKRE